MKNDKNCVNGLCHIICCHNKTTKHLDKILITYFEESEICVDEIVKNPQILGEVKITHRAIRFSTKDIHCQVELFLPLSYGLPSLHLNQ